MARTRLRRSLAPFATCAAARIHRCGDTRILFSALVRTLISPSCCNLNCFTRLPSYLIGVTTEICRILWCHWTAIRIMSRLYVIFLFIYLHSTSYVETRNYKLLLTGLYTTLLLKTSVGPHQYRAKLLSAKKREFDAADRDRKRKRRKSETPRSKSTLGTFEAY